MKMIKHRVFLKSSITSSLALALPFSRVIGANNDIRSAVVVFTVKEKPIAYFKIPVVRVVALCDVDRNIIYRGVSVLKERNIKFVSYIDVS